MAKAFATQSNAAGNREGNKDATVFVGEVDPQADEELLWELFQQTGRVVRVHIPRSRDTGAPQGFAFVEYASATDAEYTLRVLNMVSLFGRILRVSKSVSAKQEEESNIGANLYIGGLDHDVDERVLYDTFSSFGTIVGAPKVMRDESGAPRGFGFLSFDSFEASDAAIAAMNGQMLANRPVSVQYALKKDGKGERYGTQAERTLAAARAKSSSSSGSSAGAAALAGARAPHALSGAAGFGAAPPMPPHMMQQQQQQQQQQFAAPLPGQPPMPMPMHMPMHMQMPMRGGGMPMPPPHMQFAGRPGMPMHMPMPHGMPPPHAMHMQWRGNMAPPPHMMPAMHAQQQPPPMMPQPGRR